MGVVARQSLGDAALSPPVHEAWAALLRDAHDALNRASVPTNGRRSWIVPGRIEVLGKHVDYAGGRSLLCTVERALVVVARARDDGRVVLRDARRRETMSLSLTHPQRSAVPWSVYPRTVVARLMRNFGEVMTGMDAALASNLPAAAGVSSSSALTVGLSLAMLSLSNVARLPRWNSSIPDRLALAAYIGALENGMNYGDLAGERGVGTLGGAQDQTAILCCSPHQLDVFQWMPVRHEQSVAWPSDARFVVAVSGVIASKTGAAKERYNRAARTAHRIVHAWNSYAGDSVRSLRDAFLSAAGAAQAGPPIPQAQTLVPSQVSSQVPAEVPTQVPTLVPTEVPASLRAAVEAVADPDYPAARLNARLDQFFRETFELVPQAADALRQGDLLRFGALVDASQAGAEQGLENQVTETVRLQRIARELGADAASAFGAGFGGSVWAMIPARHAEAFALRWRDLYARAHPQSAKRAQFFSTAPGVAAFEVLD